MWWILGNYNMLTCGACFPQSHSIQLSWRNRPSYQQEQPTAGWSLDGRIQRLLLYHLTRYRSLRLHVFSPTFIIEEYVSDSLKMTYTVKVLGIYRGVRDLLHILFSVHSSLKADTDRPHYRSILGLLILHLANCSERMCLVYFIILFSYRVLFFSSI